MPHIPRGPVPATLAAGRAQLLVDDHAADTGLRLVTWVRAGSGADRPGQEGLAALVAYAMAPAELRERVTQLGATFSVAVERDVVGFTLTCPPSQAARCVGLWGALLEPTAIDPLAWEDARRHAAARLQRLHVGSGRRGDALLDRLVFEGHSYGHPSDGRTGTLAVLTSAEGERFRRSHWVRQATATGLGGPWRDEDRAAVVNVLDGLPSSIPPEPSRFTARHLEGRELLVVPEAETAWLHAGHALPVDLTQRDRFLLGLGLSIGAERLPSLELRPGLERAHPRWAVQVGPHPRVTAAQAEQLLALVDGLAQGGITPGEWLRAKSAMARILDALESDPASAVSYNSRSALLGEPTPLELRQWLREASAEAISQVLRVCLRPNGLKVVVSGPGATDVRAQAQELGFGEIWETPSDGWFR